MQPVLDERERDRIRSALKAYKSSHGIGDPALHKRMLNLLNCLDSEVPLPTLQRFLRGTHRTDDGMVRRYIKFLELAAPTPPYEKMGEALAEFYGDRLRTPRTRIAGRLMRRFARRYFCYARGKSKYGVTNEEMTGFPRNADDSLVGIDFKVPYSILEFDPLPGTVFMRATEWVYNERRHPGIEVHPEGWGAMALLLNEGTLSQIGEQDYYQIMLRSVRKNELAKPSMYLVHPFAWWLGDDDGDITRRPLEGTCLRAKNQDFQKGNIESFDVRLYPQAAPA